jgi:hypothetical protein
MAEFKARWLSKKIETGVSGLPARAVKDMAKNQKSESAGSDTRN